MGARRRTSSIIAVANDVTATTISAPQRMLIAVPQPD
jgi:hypothetical protein